MSPGRTPIPCAHCNSDLKFATLLDRARGFDAEVVATGHYARVETDDPEPGAVCSAAGWIPARISRISCFR